MLKLNSIDKRFKSIVVADNVNVQLENCTYGLLGRNGSGKTTLLRCITKIEKLNGGSITYSDGVKETNDYLTHIGYLPQNFEIFNELTTYEVLQFFANLKDYGITDDEINNLLKSLNLFSKKDTVVKKLSGGMKRRLGIAQALIGNPDIVLLDEPTAGLDPEERLNFKNVVREIKKDRCVVLSTHIITDIESLCDKILILSNGAITQFNSCDELADVANGKVFAVNSTDNIDAPFYSMGTIYIDGKTYEKVICLNKIDALPLAPTVEDGYICFIENLS
jgi:ABC-2 type transport system ATP-binding protein